MSSIWEPNRLYSLLRPYVDWCTRCSYTQLRYRGEDVPEEGSVIITPNHTNTLMDALVILASRKDATVFGARADMFRKPALARILRFLRILPMLRQRDGMEHLTENYHSFDEIDDTLAHDVPFCLFPEGTHKPWRSLLPVKKGVARIAARSAAQRPTKVVPAGISYSCFYFFRGVCEVRFGEPLDVNDFVREHPGLTEAQLWQELRAEIERRMKALVPPAGPAQEKPSPLILLLWPLAAVLSFPMWCTAEFICAKIPDKAACNSIRCAAMILLLPPTMLIWSLLIGLLVSWKFVLPILVCLIFSYPVFYDGLNFILWKKIK